MHFLTGKFFDASSGYTFNWTDSKAYYVKDSNGNYYWIKSVTGTTVTYMTSDYVSPPSSVDLTKLLEACIVLTDMNLATAVDTITHTVKTPSLSNGTVYSVTGGTISDARKDIYSYPSLEGDSNFYIAEVEITDGMVPFTCAVIYGDANTADPISLTPVTGTTNKWRLFWKDSASADATYSGVKIVVNDSAAHFKETVLNLHRFKKDPSFTSSFNSGAPNYPVQPFTSPNLYVISKDRSAAADPIATLTRTGGDSTALNNVSFVISTDSKISFTNNNTSTTTLFVADGAVAGSYNITNFVHQENGVTWNVFQYWDQSTSLTVVFYNQISVLNLSAKWSLFTSPSTYTDFHYDSLNKKQEIASNQLDAARLGVGRFDSSLKLGVGDLKVTLKTDYTPTLLTNVQFPFTLDSSTQISYNPFVDYTKVNPNDFSGPAKLTITDQTTSDSVDISISSVKIVKPLATLSSPSSTPLTSTNSAVQRAYQNNTFWYFVDVTKVDQNKTSANEVTLFKASDLLDANSGSFSDEGLRCELIQQVSKRGTTAPTTVFFGTVTYVSTTKVSLDNLASSIDGAYQGHAITFNSQSYVIQSYVGGSTKTATLSANIPQQFVGGYDCAVSFIPSTSSFSQNTGGYGLRTTPSFSGPFATPGASSSASVALSLYMSNPFSIFDSDAEYLSGIYTLRFYDSMTYINTDGTVVNYLDISVGIVFWKPQSISFAGNSVWAGNKSNSDATVTLGIDGFVGYQQWSTYTPSLSIATTSKSADTVTDYQIGDVSLPSGRASVTLSVNNTDKATLAVATAFDPRLTQAGVETNGSVKTVYKYSDGDLDSQSTLTATQGAQKFYYSATTSFLLQDSTSQTFTQNFITGNDPLFFDNGLTTVNYLGDFSTSQYNDLYPDSPAQIFSMGSGAVVLTGSISSLDTTNKKVSISVLFNVPKNTYVSCVINDTANITNHSYDSSSKTLTCTVDNLDSSWQTGDSATIKTQSSILPQNNSGVQCKVVVQKLADDQDFTAFLNGIKNISSSDFDTLQSSPNSAILVKTGADSYSSTASTTLTPTNASTTYDFFVPDPSIKVTADMPVTPIYAVVKCLYFPSTKQIISKYHVLQWTQDSNFSTMTLEPLLMFSFCDSASLRMIPGVTQTRTDASESDADRFRGMMLKWKLERKISTSLNWEDAVDSSGARMNYLDGSRATHPGHKAHSINAMLQSLPERVNASSTYPGYNGSTPPADFYCYRLTARRYQLFRNPRASFNTNYIEALPQTPSTTAFSIQYANDMNIVVSNELQLLAPENSVDRPSISDLAAPNRYNVKSYDKQVVASRMVRCRDSLNLSFRNVYRPFQTDNVSDPTSMDPSVITTDVVETEDDTSDLNITQYSSTVGVTDFNIYITNAFETFTMMTLNPRYFYCPTSNLQYNNIYTTANLRRGYVSNNNAVTFGKLSVVKENSYEPTFIGNSSLDSNGQITLGTRRTPSLEYTGFAVYTYDATAKVASLTFTTTVDVKSNTYTAQSIELFSFTPSTTEYLFLLTFLITFSFPVSQPQRAMPPKLMLELPPHTQRRIRDNTQLFSRARCLISSLAEQNALFRP